MIAAFSGTRHGMTIRQAATVRDLLRLRAPEEVHHGDCIGADANFHLICQEVLRNMHIRIVTHPPIDSRLRAWCEGNEERWPKPYLVRDRDMVDEAPDLLIAAPHGFVEQRRKSGTWYTVRYANRMKREVIIVYPDGTQKEYQP